VPPKCGVPITADAEAAAAAAAAATATVRSSLDVLACAAREPLSDSFKAGEPSPKRQTPGATLASDDEKGISAAPTHKACRTEREVATAACYGWETDDRATV